MIGRICVLMLICRMLWYSIAVSKTAITRPAANSAQPKREKSYRKALIHGSSKSSAPIPAIMVKKSPIALNTAS